MASKQIMHYVQDTFSHESDGGPALCGVKVTPANSTENPMGVSCQRCRKAMAKLLGGKLVEQKPGMVAMFVGPKETEPVVVQEPVEVTVEEPKGEEVEAKEQVNGQAAPTPVDEALEEIKAREYKIMADGVLLDEADNVSDACKAAVEASVGLGEDTIVEVVKTGITRFKYRGGHHLPLKNAPKSAKPTPKVANIKDAKPKAAATGAKPKEAKPKANGAGAVNDCVCGCGGKTGKTFVPGHDARVHSWMKQIAKGTKKMAEFPAISQKYMKAHTAA